VQGVGATRRNNVEMLISKYGADAKSPGLLLTLADCPKGAFDQRS